MGMKRWDHPPGTCRAVNAALGPHIVVCRPCRRYVRLPSIDVPYEPCPFVCRQCGARGEIVDADDTPEGYSDAAGRPSPETKKAPAPG